MFLQKKIYVKTASRSDNKPAVCLNLLVFLQKITSAEEGIRIASGDCVSVSIRPRSDYKNVKSAHGLHCRFIR